MDEITREEKIKEEESPEQNSEELKTQELAKRMWNQESRKRAGTEVRINPG